MPGFGIPYPKCVLRRLAELPQPFLALAQRLLGLLALADIGEQDGDAVSLAVQREDVEVEGQGEHVTFEYRVRRPINGEVHWLRNTDFPITDEHGNVIMIGGMHRPSLFTSIVMNRSGTG